MKDAHDPGVLCPRSCGLGQLYVRVSVQGSAMRLGDKDSGDMNSLLAEAGGYRAVASTMLGSVPIPWQ